jgi:hypothetical protein
VALTCPVFLARNRECRPIQHCTLTFCFPVARCTLPVLLLIVGHIVHWEFTNYYKSIAYNHLTLKKYDIGIISRWQGVTGNGQ